MMQSAYRELAPAAPSREHMGKVGVAKPRGTAAHCPAVPWHQSVTSMWVPEDAGGWGGVLATVSLTLPGKDGFRLILKDLGPRYPCRWRRLQSAGPAPGGASESGLPSPITLGRTAGLACPGVRELPLRTAAPRWPGTRGGERVAL